VPEFNPLRDWPGSCKPTSIVKLDDKRLGLRFTSSKSGRMTMPLGQATFTMLLPRGFRLR
jgi:hypothetical protein